MLQPLDERARAVADADDGDVDEFHEFTWYAAVARLYRW
jgi:hypothetical protein